MLLLIQFSFPVYILSSALFTAFLVFLALAVVFWLYKFVASLIVGG